jgi:diguanylate cyclase (GGDEF)-like protein/PAS domain S-box-containing protein
MDLHIMKQRAKAFDYLFDAVVVVDMEGIIVDWNQGSEKLYGYTKEEAVGQAVSILHVPEDVERITQEVMTEVAACGKWTGEVRMLHKDGHVGWIESMCVPIFDDENKEMIGALGINRDITGRREETERLSHLAHYDSLTEIPNRYLLLERVNHLISQARRTKMEFSLLYIDLDKFKNINDTKGHAFGDTLLKEVAKRISKVIRKSDTLARIGGDEFVLLLENSSQEHEVSVVEKEIHKALDDEFTLDGYSFYISCSIGIAVYPKDGTTIDSLLAAADKAMYLAKDDRAQQS